MAIKKSVAVWLIYKGISPCGSVLLQKRAETEMVDGAEKIQSNPYICQPTWNEKAKEGEDIENVIRRGAREELGEEFTENFSFQLVEFGREDYQYKGENFIGFNFVGLIFSEQLRLVKLHSGAMPNFVVITKYAWESGSVSTKSSNLDPKKNIVLFDDQFKTLQKLFFLRSILAHLV